MSLPRVAYILNVFPKVSETFIAGELAELRRRGVEVRILSLRPPPAGVRHEIVTRAGLLDVTEYDASRFSRIVQDFRPQILHAHFGTEPALAARQLAVELGIPFTFTAHGYDIYRRPPSDFGARALAAAGIVTVSEANARYIVHVFRVPRDRIRVIPCGIDLQQFRPNGMRAAPPHVVCVARLRPVKNLALLLEACAVMQWRGLEFRCVLVGDGPERDKLVETRDQLGLRGVVEMAGASEQSGVARWWQAASVAALTSSSEGMPVSLMEAAACGVPAVATAVGGVPELVDQGITGLLVPPGDARAAADALELLLRDPDLRARMGAAARQRAEERFSVTRAVDHLLALWADVSSPAPWRTR